MALPRLNEVPEYELVIPSTKERVSYRPFLVKEQKILLIAAESQDKKQMLSAVINMVESCVSGLKKDKLTTFDLDYIFTQIRSKSVGESTELIAICTDCEHQNKIAVDLDKAKLSSEPKQSKVNLTDDIIVEMKYPSYRDIMNTEAIVNGSSQTEMAIEMIKISLDKIFTDEEAIIVKDESDAEINRFIDSLNDDQFRKLSEFIQDIPKLQIDNSFKCENCGKENTRSIEGIEAFF